MKAAFVVLVVCALAIIAGGGLLFQGFQASSATITITSTQTSVTATTITSGVATSTTTATTQVSVQSVVLEHTYNIQSPNPTTNCGVYDEADTKLDPGTLSVSFAVTGSDVVDFWVLNSQQWITWQSVALSSSSSSNCQSVEAYPGLRSIIGVNSYNATLVIPATDLYYFVFVNKNTEGVSISLSATETFSTQTTEELFLTGYTTQSSTWQTSALVANQQPAGLGLTFFLGIVFLVAGAVAFFLGYRHELRSEGRGYRGEGSPVTVEVPARESTPVIISVPSRTGRLGEKKMSQVSCPKCGHELPADSAFCEVCGHKVDYEV